MTGERRGDTLCRRASPFAHQDRETKPRRVTLDSRRNQHQRGDETLSYVSRDNQPRTQQTDVVGRAISQLQRPVSGRRSRTKFSPDASRRRYSKTANGYRPAELTNCVDSPRPSATYSDPFQLAFPLQSWTTNPEVPSRLRSTRKRNVERRVCGGRVRRPTWKEGFGSQTLGVTHRKRPIIISRTEGSKSYSCHWRIFMFNIRPSRPRIAGLN